MNDLPGGTSGSTFTAGLYTVYLSVWSSQGPRETLRRFDFNASLDLRQGSVSGVSIVVN